MNSQRARDINELKKQAIQFYTENSDITKRVEDALNNLFYDSPYDVYGYLVIYFDFYSMFFLRNHVEIFFFIF